MKKIIIKKLSTKVIFGVVSINFIVMSFIFGFLTYTNYIERKETLEALREAHFQYFDIVIKTQVETVISLLKHKTDKELTEKEQKALKDTIRSLRYGKDGYFFIDTYEAINIVHGASKKSEGTYRGKLKDASGKLYIRQLIDDAINAGGDGAFINYTTDKKLGYTGTEKKFKKRAYAKAFPEWKWVITSGDYTEELEKELEKDAIPIWEDFYRLMIETVVAMIIGLVLLSVASIYILRYLVINPIIIFKDHLTNLTTGDFTKFTQQKTFDEIGQMFGSLIQFQDRMKTTIGKIQAIGEELASTANESSTTAETISENSQSQASTLEEVVASIEETQSGTEQVRSITEEQFILIRDTISKLDNLHSMVETIGQMMGEVSVIKEHIDNSLNDSEEQLNPTLKELDSVVSSVSEVSTSINAVNDISEGINLLSLNARIEAARAGEHGRGFSVVADEISKLADRTSEYVKSISFMIKSMNTEIKSSSDSIHTFISQIPELTKQIKTMGDFLDKVIDLIQQDISMNREVKSYTNKIVEGSDTIKSAMGEQTVAMQEVSKATSEINTMVQSTAASAEEMSASSENLSAMAEKLREELSFFQVK